MSRSIVQARRVRQGQSSQLILVRKLLLSPLLGIAQVIPGIVCTNLHLSNIYQDYCCWFWSNWILLHMPLNMKCNITIDYTIAVVPDVNEFNWVLQNQVDVAFLSSSFCKFFDQLCAQEWCFLLNFLLVLKILKFLRAFLVSSSFKIFCCFL